MIIVFAISSFLERFILVKAGANATRDHYISTTFLAISFFVYALKSNWNNEILALIGRRYSTWLYIMHPIFITLLSMVAGKFGVKSIYRCVAPIVVYCVTLVFLIVLQNDSRSLQEVTTRNHFHNCVLLHSYHSNFTGAFIAHTWISCLYYNRLRSGLQENKSTRI